MAFGRLFIARPQWEDSNGNPAVSYRLFFYAAGTSTKQNTYTSSAGTTPNSNPMVLNSLGQPNGEVWGDTSLNFKIGLAAPGADDPPASFVWTEDDIPTQVSTGGGGGGSAASEEWVSFAGTPTFTSTTTFTVTGDQTGTLHIGRRIKAAVTAGTVYGTITNSVFGSVTTVTLSLDSGVLDSGLSAIEHGLLSAVNTSRPQLVDTIDYRVGSSDPTKRVKDEVDALTTATTRTRFHIDEDTSIGGDWGLRNATMSVSVAGNALTVALKTKAGTDPSATDPVIIRFRSATATNGDHITSSITSAFSITVVSGATLGTGGSVPHRLYFLGMENSGSVVPGIYNPTALNGGLFESHVALDEDFVQSYIVMNTASDAAQQIYTSGSGVSNRPVRIIGFVEGSQSTPGTWSSSPTAASVMKIGTPKSGATIQRKNQAFTTVQDITTVTPQDDTIPQVGEGGQVGVVSIVPRSASSVLRVMSQVFASVNATNSWTLHAHRDGTSNAFSSSNVDGASGEVHPLHIDTYVTANSVSSTSIQVRAGPDGANTLTINGVSGTRIMGGTLNSYLRIEEIWA